MFLTEYFNKNIYGYIKGRVNPDSSGYYGIRYNCEREQGDVFKFALESATAGTFEHRYDFDYATDDDVEAYMAMIKQALLLGEREWLADHVKYPFWHVYHNNALVCQNKKEFIAHYDKIVSSSLIEYIKYECPFDMYWNDKGVTIGDGRIWICIPADASASKVRNFVIISIK